MRARRLADAMGRVIAQEKIEEVERLVAEHRLTLAEIAIQTGISKATVQAVASGRRRIKADHRPIKGERLKQAAGRYYGPFERCPDCGGMVYALAPCSLCRVRKLKERDKQQRDADREAARRERLKRVLATVEEFQNRSS